MFAALSEYTLFIFAACNVIAIPMVWALYPESNQRTLEEMNLVFAADRIWNWKAERSYATLKEENPELVQAAARSQSIVSMRDPETGMVRISSRANGRRPSLIVVRLVGCQGCRKDVYLVGRPASLYV
jgi:hypothetical protein